MTEKGKTRRRWRWLAGVAVANLAAVGLVAGPSQAQQAPSLCAGTAENFTIVGDLAVPAGEACLLINSTVTGDVIVRAEAALFLESSTVLGDLTVRRDGIAELIGSRVGGTAVGRQAFGIGTLESQLVGGVDVRNSGFYDSIGSRHDGTVLTVNNLSTVLESSRVNGDVRSRGDVATDVFDSVVTGRLVGNEVEFGVVVCESEIDGQVTIRDNGAGGAFALVQFGPGPVAGCAFNVFAAGIALQDNVAEIHVNGNVIRDNLACAGNDVTPAGEGNRIRGDLVGQCADLAPFTAGFTSRALPDLAAHHAAVKADREARVAQDRAAAVAAGPANL